jgi:hypothetical protein
LPGKPGKVLFCAQPSENTMWFLKKRTKELGLCFRELCSASASRFGSLDPFPIRVGQKIAVGKGSSAIMETRRQGDPDTRNTAKVRVPGLLRPSGLAMTPVHRLGE